MSTCSSQDLMDAGSCFAALPSRQLQVVTAGLLVKILQAANPMADCSTQGLMDAAKCFMALSPQQLQAVMAQLLCEILNAGGGGGGQSCIICATVDPSDAPACDCALYYRKDNMAVWLWDSEAQQWVALITPMQ